MASGGADLEARWPAWPEGEPGTTLLDVVLGLSVDEAFALLYGGLTDMRVRARQSRGRGKAHALQGWAEAVPLHAPAHECWLPAAASWLTAVRTRGPAPTTSRRR